MSGPDPLAEKSGCRTAALWVAGMALASVVLTAVTIYFLVARVGDDVRAMADQIAQQFDATLQFRPEIRVDGQVVVEASKPDFQVITATQEGTARYRWSNTYIYSTKEIEIEAPFTARAGFILSDPLRVRIEPYTRRVDADTPRASLISLEIGDPRILRDEDGLWNKLTAEDREQAFKELRRIAREKVDASGLVPKATIEAENRIREILAASQAQTPPP